jgi:hypothetical protein
MSYEPLINEKRNVFCMNYNVDNPYQDYLNRVGFVPEIVHELFDREVKFLTKFQKFSWAPEILDIVDKRIYIRWHDNTCNDVIQSGKELPSGWKEQLNCIIRDQLHEQVYKVTQYPHCFYIDNDGQLGTFDFYGCFDFDDYLIPYSKIKGLISEHSEGRITEVQDGDMINLKDMFLNSLRTHIKWPDNHLNTIYNSL